MELEAGMYIKTQDGRICKILKLNEPLEDDGYLDHNDIGSASIQEKNVIKASFNIIDLIEVGDYVNGEKICNIINKDKDYCYLMKNSDKYFDDKDIIAGSDAYSYQKPIKDIVTKEQFDACKYVVERDK